MSEWQDISTAPKGGRPLRLRLEDGREVIGILEPYWCGADCPCGTPGDGEPFTAPPQCWHIPDEQELPTHWKTP